MTQTNRLIMRDETLRDGNQGEAPRSAFRGVEHLITMAPYFDMMSIGWIYTNPADIEVAKYLREHNAEMAARAKDFNKDKLYIYTLVHLKNQKTPEEVIKDDRADILKREAAKGNTGLTDEEIKSKHSPFAKMLLDLQSQLEPGKAPPYGTINILAKARVNDLKDFGADVTPESFQENILNTMRLLKKANPNVKLEIALEHFYTAWTEEENQAANRKHIVDTLATTLLEGSVRITAPDTDGAHTPKQITQVLRDVTATLKKDKRLTDKGIDFDPAMFIAHMHDDLGEAAKNTKAALDEGAGAFDCTVGVMGERMGNGTLADIVKELRPGDTTFDKYQHDLQKVLGLAPGDKTVGSAPAFCGTGGMHADHALKELWKFVDSGKGDYDKFVRTYNGSYASVPASKFGQKLQMTLSPVAGSANVLFMLAGLGLDLRDKKDPRIDEVLKEIKEGEYLRAVNYRGYNNANAFLLLADSFGLRNKESTRITITPSALAHEKGNALLDLQLSENAQTKSEQLRFTPNEQTVALQKYDDSHDPHTDGAEALKAVAKGLLAQAKKKLIGLDKQFQRDRRFDQIAIKDLRVLEAPVGGVEPENGDIMRPKPEKVRSAVKLFFTTGSKETYQANGSGDSYEEAIGMALQTIFNFRCLQLERAQLQGQSKFN